MLPSWRPGPVRDAVLEFLADARELPLSERVATFDNDGTLWCERPTFVQLDFFAAELRSMAAADPSVRDRAEYAAVLAGDPTAMSALGLERIGYALLEMFVGQAPATFEALAVAFLATARNEALGIPIRRTRYQPMLELIDELRQLEFTVALVTGGGTEFVRAISQDLYGVPPELVVGTLIDYDFGRAADGSPGLTRTAQLQSPVNEGAAKISLIQGQLGRRPIMAAGNSGGDREMLEWASAGDGPSLALLIDHDDAEREFRYVSTAQSFTEDEPITDVGHRLGWTVVSMARDWSTIFVP
jgi:phosphoserine phosphatase